MKLKLVWALWRAYNKLLTLNKEDIMGLGWKTITGAVVMGLGFACKALSTVIPALDAIGDALIAIGVALGGIGVRAAIGKIPNPPES